MLVYSVDKQQSSTKTVWCRLRNNHLGRNLSVVEDDVKESKSHIPMFVPTPLSKVRKTHQIPYASNVRASIIYMVYVRIYLVRMHA